MILISTSEDDFSTVSVMCWLKYLKKDFIISNPHNNIEIEDIRISNDNLELNLTLENANNIKFNLNTLDSYQGKRILIVNHLSTIT